MCGAAIVSSILRKHNIKHEYSRLCDSGLPFGSYGYLTKEELEKRWYYVTEDNRKLRVGIVVEPPRKNNLVHIR